MDSSATLGTTVPAVSSTRRERVAWYLYDFGNSAYAAVVLLAVYSALKSVSPHETVARALRSQRSRPSIEWLM